MPKSTALLLLLAALYSGPAAAWGHFEHMVIAELTLQKLEPKLQRRLEQDAFALVQRQTPKRRLHLMRAFAGTSAFAHLSVFADTHKRTPLAQLYTQFGDRLPPALAEREAGQRDSSRWHYQSRAYVPHLDRPAPTAKPCAPPAQGELVWAVQQLRKAMEAPDSAAQQRLSLALLVHLVADAHQPLHAISRFDDRCRSDYGGNRFCVAYRPNSRSCATNLHAFWDKALGFFRRHGSVGEAAAFLRRVEVDAAQARTLEPQVWLDEGYRHARQVYALTAGAGADPHYTQQGQVIAYQRMALAAERLAQLLRQIY
ncbi:MAG: S1/P1 nuclease [Cellvibrionales bacterium]|nr:S1/P1 nuclease [Cellvibrionales bacterium]